MLTCREMSELVTPYLERAVSLRARLNIRRHLMLCQACRHYYDQMRRVVRLLGANHPVSPDRGAESGVLTALRRGQSPDV